MNNVNKRRKIRVLVVDDSLLFRETIARGISLDEGIEVVASASDVFSARDKIIQFRPEVMTLDIEMPKMNGIEFLRKLMPQYPIPVVVVSAVNETVFEAMDAGAVDFVSKPNADNLIGLEGLINELIIKIKVASTAKLGNWKQIQSNSRRTTLCPKIFKNIIAIGASTGGTEALYNIIKSFPRDMPGIVITQHMPPVFTNIFAKRLDNGCQLEVREAKDGDKLYQGLALIAPGDSHMRLKKSGTEYYVECFKGEKVNGHCPSVDVLFESVAQTVKKDAIGIILTGMGYDGAKGLLSMRKNGARTIGQDEKSCVIYGMPKVAYNIGAVEQQASLEKIPSIVYSLLNI